MATAREELHSLLNEDQLRDASLLVYANKQDLSNAMGASEVGRELALIGKDSVRNPWYVQPASATTRDGLYEGLDWLSKNVNTN